MSQITSLKQEYKEKFLPELKKELGIKNIHAIPQITMVKINVGIGNHVTSGNKDFSYIVDNIAKITGQKPVVNKARQSISNFKLREGMPVGISVTLRDEVMFSFLTRLVNIALPRVRDFRGISPKSFDGRGNYHLGIKECTIFPEVTTEDLSKVHGLQISIVTTANNNEEGFALLKKFGFPFKK